MISRQGWQGRWGALTSAPRPAPPGKNQRTRRTALVRIRALRRHAVRHATTSSGIMYDAVPLCIRKMSARAYASGALRRHAMLHIIRYPTRISSAYRHKPLMPLPSDCNNLHWLLSRNRCKPVAHFRVNLPVGTGQTNYFHRNRQKLPAPELACLLMPAHDERA